MDDTLAMVHWCEILGATPIPLLAPLLKGILTTPSR
jgi:hypothetical protein